MPIKGTYYNATLGAAPTTSAHLGYWVQGSLIATSTSGTANTIWSISLDPGSWIIVGNGTFQVGASIAILSISTTNNTRESYYEVIINISAGGPALNITRIPKISVTTIFYLVAQSNVVTNVSSTVLQAMRVG
jgi:hypothetical protein